MLSLMHSNGRGGTLEDASSWLGHRQGKSHEDDAAIEARSAAGAGMGGSDVGARAGAKVDTSSDSHNDGHSIGTWHQCGYNAQARGLATTMAIPRDDAAHNPLGDMMDIPMASSSPSANDVGTVHAHSFDIERSVLYQC
jgi:hypothetical protein